jgi:uncharacterized protein YbaP (TraB family)
MIQRRIALGIILSLAALPACSQNAAPVAPVASDTGVSVLTEAKPALWKIKGAKGTLYLFGSVHVMKKEVHWDTGKVKAAFDASDALYLEIAGLDEVAQKAMQPDVMALGMDTEHPLSTKISKEDVTLLDDAVKSLGLPGESALEPMRPWLAFISIATLPLVKAGYDLNSGIDKALEEEAKAAKKPVHGFETALSQMHALSDMPEDLQVKALHVELEELPAEPARLQKMVADWSHGDVEAIGKQDERELKARVPELYDRLVVKRNVAFTDGIEKLLKDPSTGTVFAAIGAGHLAGDESVLALLKARGFVSERIQ